MIQKRGGNLSAPFPKGEIGKCGYLNEMTKENLFKYIREYLYCCKISKKGRTSLFHVGLEDPGTVFRNTKENIIENSKIN